MKIYNKPYFKVFLHPFILINILFFLPLIKSSLAKTLDWELIYCLFEKGEFKELKSHIETSVKKNAKLNFNEELMIIYAITEELLGNVENALNNYISVYNINGSLGDYGLILAGELCLKMGEFKNAREFFTLILERYPESILHLKARKGIALAFQKENKFEEAIDIYKMIVSLYRVRTIWAEASQEIAHLYHQLGHPDKSVFWLRKIVDHNQRDKEAFKAIEELESLYSQYPHLKNSRTLKQDFKEARVFYYKGEFNKARKAFKEFVERHSQSMEARDADFMVGMAYYMEGDYKNAIPFFEKLCEKYKITSFIIKCRIQISRCYRRLNNLEKSFEQLNYLVNKYPSSSGVDEAYLNIGNYYFQKSNYHKAKEYYSIMLEKFPNSSFYNDASFQLYLVYKKLGNSDEAIKSLERIIERGEKKFYEEALYWLGQELQNRKEFLRAYKIFYQLISESPGTYYREKVKSTMAKIYRLDEEIDKFVSELIEEALNISDSDLKTNIKKIEDALRVCADSEKEKNLRQRLIELKAKDYNWAKLYEIRRMGDLNADRYFLLEGKSNLMKKLRIFHRLNLDDYLRNELDKYLSSSKKDISFILRAIEILYEKGEPNFALKYFQKLSDLLSIQSDRAYWDVELLALGYPRAFEKAVRNSSKKYGIDPLFVLSIARAESMFKKDVVSSAGAVGLMQIIPATARDISLKMKKDHGNYTKLFEPEYNIEMGCFVINELLRKYSNRLAVVAACYNAGETSVNEWLKRAGENPSDEEFIAYITFDQTREYVKKVLKNYSIYKSLYMNFDF